MHRGFASMSLAFKGGADSVRLKDAMASVLAERGALSVHDLTDEVRERFNVSHSNFEVGIDGQPREQLETLRALVEVTAKSRREFTYDLGDADMRIRLAGAPGRWSREELAASVGAYLQMRELAMVRAAFIKKTYYRTLSSEFGRRLSSYEYRMRNISAVLSSQGRYWIPGLPPAKNVGKQVAATITALLYEFEGRKYDVLTTPDPIIQTKGPPAGVSAPMLEPSTIWRFVRDPNVRDWVLSSARGICEGCEKPAPFESVAGPFLEVHHLRRLADGGADTVTNAVALCPNCHRRFHYSLNATQLVEAMYEKLERLERPPSEVPTTFPHVE